MQGKINSLEENTKKIIENNDMKINELNNVIINEKNNTENISTELSQVKENYINIKNAINEKNILLKNTEVYLDEINVERIKESEVNKNECISVENNYKNKLLLVEKEMEIKNNENIKILNENFDQILSETNEEYSEKEKVKECSCTLHFFCSFFVFLFYYFLSNYFLLNCFLF